LAFRRSLIRTRALSAVLRPRIESIAFFRLGWQFAHIVAPADRSAGREETRSASRALIVPWRAFAKLTRLRLLQNLSRRAEPSGAAGIGRTVRCRRDADRARRTACKMQGKYRGACADTRGEKPPPLACAHCAMASFRQGYPAASFCSASFLARTRSMRRDRTTRREDLAHSTQAGDVAPAGSRILRQPPTPSCGCAVQIASLVGCPASAPHARPPAHAPAACGVPAAPPP